MLNARTSSMTLASFWTSTHSDTETNRYWLHDVQYSYELSCVHNMFDCSGSRVFAYIFCLFLSSKKMWWKENQRTQCLFKIQRTAHIWCTSWPNHFQTAEHAATILTVGYVSQPSRAVGSAHTHDTPEGGGSLEKSTQAKNTPNPPLEVKVRKDSVLHLLS